MMTDPTLDAVNAVRDDLRAMRGDLGTMVTRREHEAEVRRLDAEAAAVRATLAQHTRDADRRLDDVKATAAAGDAKILAAVEADRAQRAEEAKTAVAQRKADRRWVVGAVIAAAGVAVALAQLLRALL